MGSAIYYSNYFSVYFDVKERYNPQDYFCMGIIEKVEDPARNQKPCAEMIRKLKIKVYGMRRKKG